MKWDHSFKLETDMPFYDNMMDSPDYHRDYKGYEFLIVLMPPQAYLTYVDIGEREPLGSQIIQMESNLFSLLDLVLPYAERMRAGDKFPMLTLDYTRMGRGFSQEGRHRAYAAIKAHVDLVPVLVTFESGDRKKIESRFKIYQKL